MTDDDKFDYAVNVVLQHEGGISDNPNDPGGLTNFGITKSFLIDNKILTPHDYNKEYIRSLTRNEAINLYRTYIWYKYHYGLFYSLEIATKVFDMTVNMGVNQSHKLLQKSINFMSKDPILVDGVLGVKTITAANSLPASYLHEELREQCKNFYNNLVKQEPKMYWALPGWLNRAAW
jgi:lysozyme family protein